MRADPGGAGEAPAGAGQRGLGFVLVTVLLDMMGIGLIVPVLPDLVRSVADTDLAGAAVIGGWLSVAYSAMQFLFGPVIGNLSDAVGRRIVLIAAVGGLGADYLVMAMAPSIGWLFAGRLLSGLCGASYTTANAFIADVTPPAERARAFGLIGAAFGVGFVLGPAIGGLLGQFGPRMPFFAAAGLSLCNLLWGLFAVPESLPPERRRPFDLRRANPLGGLASLWRMKRSLGLALIFFLAALAQTVYFSVWSYSTMARYGWQEGTIGLSLAAFGLVTAVAQASLMGPVVKRLGPRRAALVSITVGTLTALGYGTAPAGWMVFPLILLGCLQGLAAPALNAMLSRRAPPDAQGELQGVIASLQGIASILGPPLMTGLFHAFSAPGAPLILPGAPFLFAAVLLTGAGLLLQRQRD